MEIRTKSYQLKINIRDTQGVDDHVRLSIQELWVILFYIILVYYYKVKHKNNSIHKF